MKKEKLAEILMYLGIALFFFGLGWFFGRNYELPGIELWRFVLIVIGIALMIISLLPKKK